MRINFVLSLMIITLFIAGGCKKPVRPPSPDPTVTVAAVRKDKVVETVTKVARVKANNKAEIVARVKGFLLKTNFTEGGAVKKGDLLFLIEQDEYKANLEKAEGVLLSALAAQRNSDLDYERQKGLYEKRAVAKRNYDEALATKMKADAVVMQAKAAVKLARLDLSYTEIRAPFDGYVGLENYSIGNVVSPTNGPLTSVVDMSTVRVQYNITDKLVLRAREMGYDSVKGAGNIKVVLYTVDGAMYKYPGKITFWDNQINQSTGTLAMQAMFPNPELLLVPGMYVRVAIDISEKNNALLIPEIAVAQDLSGSYVMVVDKDSKVERRNVILGIRQGKDVEVIKGLEAGEKVVVEGLQHIRPGIRVNVDAAGKPDVTKTTEIKKTEKAE